MDCCQPCSSGVFTSVTPIALLFLSRGRAEIHATEVNESSQCWVFVDLSIYQWKFSTSIKLLLTWSRWLYKINLSSGESASPSVTDRGIVTTGEICRVAKGKNASSCPICVGARADSRGERYLTGTSSGSERLRSLSHSSVMLWLAFLGVCSSRSGMKISRPACAVMRV